MRDETDVTELLHSWNRGDLSALDQLMPIVFDELRHIAGQQLAGEGNGHTLQPTALVSELYLKLLSQRRVQWRDRGEFFGVSARIVRRILVDHARRHQAKKRGGEADTTSLEEVTGLTVQQFPDLLALDDALKDLEKANPRASKVVELHAFTGLDFKEIAAVLDISRSTAIRDWNFSRLWLRRELAPAEAAPSQKKQGVLDGRL